MKKYDYYYSAKFEKHLKECSELFGDEQPYRDTFINGQVYTEMVEQGIEPVSRHFGDLVKLNVDGDELIETKKLSQDLKEILSKFQTTDPDKILKDFFEFLEHRDYLTCDITKKQQIIDDFKDSTFFS